MTSCLQPPFSLAVEVGLLHTRALCTTATTIVATGEPPLHLSDLQSSLDKETIINKKFNVNIFNILEEGGLRMRVGRKQNIALLGKLVWDLLTPTNIFLARDGKGSPIWKHAFHLNGIFPLIIHFIFPLNFRLDILGNLREHGLHTF